MTPWEVHFQFESFAASLLSSISHLYSVRYLPRNAPEDVVVEIPGLVEVASVEGYAILLAPSLGLVQVVPVGLKET